MRSDSSHGRSLKSNWDGLAHVITKWWKSAVYTWDKVRPCNIHSDVNLITTKKPVRNMFIRMSSYRVHCKFATDEWKLDHEAKEGDKCYLHLVKGGAGGRMFDALTRPCTTRKQTDEHDLSTVFFYYASSSRIRITSCAGQHTSHTIKFNVSAHNNFYRCSNTFLFTRPLPQT